MKNRVIFATVYPEMAKEWHPTLNGSLTPDRIAPRSNKEYYWLCEKGHVFVLSADKRSQGQGCYYCSCRRLLVGFNDLKTRFPEDAAEWDYEKNVDRPEDYTCISHTEKYWICSECGHKWKTSIKTKVSARYNGCERCAHKKNAELRVERAAKKTGGIVDPLLLKEWDYENNTKGPENYSPNSNISVGWVCSECGYHYNAKIGNRSILGRGCPACANKVIWPGHNDLATTHPQIAAEWHPTLNGNLTPKDVVHGTATVVWWKCPEGHDYQASILHRTQEKNATNCPVCFKGRQSSFAEQAVYYYVKKVFPDAINHYRDIFDNSMELDIYIPSIRLGIEYDGEAFHKKDKEERERKKYLICKANGITLKRLIERRIEGKNLNADSILSLPDKQMYEHENLELVIRALLDEIDPDSNYWTRKHPLHVHSDIDINIKRDELEIRKYMTKLNGNSLSVVFPSIAAEWHPTLNGDVTPDKVKPYSDIKYWWLCPDCGLEYMATISHRSCGTACPKCAIERNAARKRKRVLMIDATTRVVLQEFESITDAHVKTGINRSNISSVCKGDRKKAGGYYWEYGE